MGRTLAYGGVPSVSVSHVAIIIEYSRYALDESPLIVNRFAQETLRYHTGRHAWGGEVRLNGTSVAASRNVDDNIILIMLDLLGGPAGVNDGISGERVTVNGTRGDPA